MHCKVGDLVLSPINPNYVCIFEQINWKVLPPTYPHPFPLTGPPEARIEKMLTVAQKVLLKIKVTENPVYLLQPQQFDNLEKDLWDLRSKMYFNRICGGDQDPYKTMALVTDNFRSSTVLWRIMRKFIGSQYLQIGGDDYKLLTTYALVVELIRSTVYIRSENLLKSPNLLPKDFRQMTKKEEFFEVADKIIEALDKQVVPITDLAVIACRGKTEQNCSQCGRKIVVQSIFLEDFPLKDARAKIVFKPLEDERYVCGG